MSIYDNLRRLIAGLERRLATLVPPRRLEIISGDTLPDKLPRRALVLARDDGEDWCVGFRCPCGCGRKIELLLIKEARPRWDLTIDARRRPTLKPSVWLDTGCGSHFWIRNGRVQWCE